MKRFINAVLYAVVFGHFMIGGWAFADKTVEGSVKFKEPDFTITGNQVAITTLSTTNIPTVPTNAALTALTAGSQTMVARAGFTAAGDAPTGIYVWSSSICSLASGVGDNGSQVAPASGTGCWLLAKQAEYDVRQWGVALSNPIHLKVLTTGADTPLCGIGTLAPCLTITGAQKTANLIATGGNVVEIDLPDGVTYNECISQTGPLRGAITDRPNPIGNTVNLGPTMLLVKGQGPNTIWNGCPQFFYTFQASNGGQIGIQNLQMRSTGGAVQLSLATQQGGQAFSLGGITWGPSNYVHVFTQDPGSLITLMGADTITAGARSFVASSGGALVQLFGGGASYEWSAELTGTYEFTNGFINVASLGMVQDDNQLGNGFINGITGRPLIVSSGGAFINQTGIALDTLLPTGTLLSLEYSTGFVVPEPPSTVLTPSTGCGTLCTTTITSGGPRSGFITIHTAGTGISSAGGFVISQGIALTQDGGAPSPCVVGGNTGGGAWSVGAVFQASSPTVSAGHQSFIVNWSNNSNNLSSGQNYFLNFVCSGS